MKIQEKPDYLIFADSAKNGESANFPDVSRGWGVTIDQTASKPPLEWMNGAFNRVDKNMMYLLQQGVPEWSEHVTYPSNAIIKYNGVLYTATVKNDNAIPTNSDKWKKTNSEIAEATTAQKGLVKLSSAIDSVSENDAATSLAIKIVNDKINDFSDKFSWSDQYQQSVVMSPDKKFYFVVRNDGVVGVYSTDVKNMIWSFSGENFNNGVIDANKINDLDKFVRDRTPPVGIPLPWPQMTPPAGWFECNGSTFNKDQCPKLATAYPHGFLPDLRGEFIRGWDNGRGADPDRGMLSWQFDAIRNIYGEFVGTAHNGYVSGAFAAHEAMNGMMQIGGTPWSDRQRYSFDATRIVPTAHENRPRNIAFMYIVKAE